MQRDPIQSSARPLGFVCAVCVAFGVYLRVQEIAFPAALTFDEHHFVENARNYLAGKPDWNDHPPLGKLLIAGAIWLLGDDSTGWRAPALGCGLLSIVLAYFAGRALFRDPLAGALSAAFVALDGFLIAYSRTALLDGMLSSFVLLTLLVLAPGPTRARLVSAGALAGLVSAIKLSGVTLALPIALGVLTARESRPVKALLLALSGFAALGVYVVQYAIGLALTGSSATPLAVMRASLALIEHHAALTQMSHPLTSYWYTWFAPLRPITLRYELVGGGMVRAMTTLGNPLLWWSSALATVGTFAWLLWWALVELRARKPLAPWLMRVWSRLLPSAFWLGFLSPWVLTRRDSYIYHYLPCYSVGLLLLAGVFARASREWPRATLIGVLVIAEVSVFYAPVWAQLPLSESAFAWRVFLPGWR